ncbi:MAG TPA: ribonuclease III [Croceibacterium sp.]|nr:ribonuclease III [Croceibacterium sp.]
MSTTKAIGLAGETRAWLEGLGFEVANESLWLEALTHGSTGAGFNYERLEFLGDRVLGLAIAGWLYRNSSGSEGELAQRLNALVSRQVCASVAREIGAPPHVQLGKQARDDGAADSDNVLGDVMEALLGASLLESGYPPTRDIVWRLWKTRVESTGRTKHPKSALQEWAAGSNRKPPEYALVARSGPDHASKFTVRVRVKNVGEIEAEASSKQDAETEAARLFMERFG